MKNSNVTIKSAVFAALAMTGFTAHAANNAQTVITGDIVAATCELEATPTVDLGNWAASEFTKVGAHNETQDLTLGISGCQGALEEGGKISATVRGYNIEGSPTVFSKSGSTNTVGVQLTDAQGTVIANGEKILIASQSKPAPEGRAGSSLDGQTLKLKAQLFSTTAETAIQHVEAPINFSITYN
ncbi:fimbrial protein [Serratia liquefaciens]|uniref:fimbrial protein n=1 Tax=Serratia liquefaciens TaxID=614 RepID=UPI002157631C|nr:fimbrial protein [Serratia liquefaciens]